MKKILIGLLVLAAIGSIILVACLNPADGSGGTNVSPRAVALNDADKAAAAAIAPKVSGRTNASGKDISSNGQGAAVPGMYFFWDPKQKDDGYLKVEALMFEKYDSFVLTTKEANKYWDFLIEPQANQKVTADGFYVFFIPKKEKNINGVWISDYIERVINWLGEFDWPYQFEDLGTPQRNWAYLDTTENTSYIFDGVKWKVLEMGPYQMKTVAAYAQSIGTTFAADLPGQYINVLLLTFQGVNTNLQTLSGSHSASILNQIPTIKSKFPHIKILMCVGGWMSGRFSEMARVPEYRASFVRNIVEYARVNNLDGCDIDWEYPVGEDHWYPNPTDIEVRANVIIPEIPPITIAKFDKENYMAFMRELRLEFDKLGEITGKKYYVSTAVPGAGWFPEKHDVVELSKYCNSLNLMCYDYYTEWSLSVGFQANLYPFPSEAPANGNRVAPAGGLYVYTTEDGRWSTSRGVEVFIDAGVHPSKLLIGMPTYANRWRGKPVSNGAGGEITSLLDPTGNGNPRYNPALPGLGSFGNGERASYSWSGSGGAKATYYGVPGNGYTIYHDEDAKASFLFNPTIGGGSGNNRWLGEWINVQDPWAIQHTVNYAKEKEVGGVMYWSIRHDADYDLVQAMFDTSGIGSF